MLAGRQRGLNFIESGHIGLMKMFSISLCINGPFSDMFLQKDPIGVDMSKPSPLNYATRILSCVH